MDVATSLLRQAGVALVASLLLPAVALRAAEAGQDARHEAADAAQLERLVDGFLAAEPISRPGTRGRCVLIPAVTDGEAGAVAGRAVAQLVTDLDRVVLLTARPRNAAATPALRTPTWESMRTALGSVPVETQALDTGAVAADLAKTEGEGPADRAMASVLPLLQRRLNKPFRVIPLDIAAGADPAAVSALVGPLLSAERTAVVVLTTESLAGGDFQGLFAPAEHTAGAGAESLPAALLALRALAVEMGWKPVVTGLANPADGRALLSAVLVEDANRLDLLAHASTAAWEDPLTKAAFEDASRAAARTNFQGDPLSQPEQAILLHLARSSVLAKLQDQPLPAPPLYSDTLARPSGCFVTLTVNGTLRGCLGTVLPKDPLATAVQQYALAAALEDKRFPPLTVQELATTRIEIGALTPLRKLDFSNGQDLLTKIKPGVHGVLLTYENSKRSTFLPQVWRQFPEPEAFLKALCRKAAIPIDGWQDPAKAVIEVYESFDFREP